MELSPELLALRNFLWVSVGLYVWGGFNFAVLGDRQLAGMNRFAERFFPGKMEPIPMPSERFWLVLTISMMLMLVVCCGLAAYDLKAYWALVIPVLFSKICSTVSYLFLFFGKKRYFAYLLGALTDGPLFVLTLVFFLRALPALS